VIFVHGTMSCALVIANFALTSANPCAVVCSIQPRTGSQVWMAGPWMPAGNRRMMPLSEGAEASMTTPRSRSRRTLGLGLDPQYMQHCHTLE
jgi:hypothetical protein